MLVIAIEPGSESKTVMSKDKLVIFDTTLRDGEQSPGASMTKDEKIRIAAFGALVESVRRFGNALSDELSQAVVEIVTKSPTGDIRMAAAEVLGGLSLPSSQIKDLILQSGGIK